MHPRLDTHCPQKLGNVRFGMGALQFTRDVATDGHDGMHDPPHTSIVSGQLGGHRFDEVRHVVGDDLDHRRVLAPTVHGTGRVEQADRRSTGNALDRKSTRLNSSHVSISYAVFCLKKKKKVTTSKDRSSNTSITR